MTGQRLREKRDTSLQATKRRRITVDKVHDAPERERLNCTRALRMAA